MTRSLLVLLAAAPACVLGGGGTTSTPTTTAPTLTAPWTGSGPMTLIVDGDTVQEDVFASGGGELGGAQPPIITVVPIDGTSAASFPDGLGFINLAMRFDADPVAAVQAFRNGEDLRGASAGFGLSLGGGGITRLVGDSQDFLCDFDATHVEALPDNPLQPDFRVHRYSIDVTCADVPWEDIGKSMAKGRFSSIETSFDALLGVGT